MNLDLSVVIPVKNEEENLKKLLPELKKQGVNEIIVADANSTDSSKLICTRYGVKIVKGGLPSVGRNSGAKHATHKTILFLDADITLSKHFIKKLYSQFIKAKVGIASVYISPIEKERKYRLIAKLWNSSLKFSEKQKKKACVGTCIICDKKAFRESGGFDEKIIFLEDCELAERMGNKYGFKLFSSPRAKVSFKRLFRGSLWRGFFYDARLILMSQFVGYKKIQNQDFVKNYFK
ncbi:Glycosyltransferase AglI [uncultured archaeon]|nr:Glycosyltransferase AglI [uncultured archaeon]